MARRIVVVVAVMLSSFFASKSFAQMSDDEEIVRNTYAKLSFLCAVPPLRQIASSPDRYAHADPAVLDDKVSQAVPIFELSDFQTGSIASIASKPWLDFVSLPSGLVLHGGWASTAIFTAPPPVGADGKWLSRSSNPSNSVEMNMVQVYWAQGSLTPSQEAYVRSYTVATAIENETSPRSDAPITITRYAAFTVNATFGGKSTAPHKAIFLFGTDKTGKEVTLPNDLISGPQPIADVLSKPAYPVALLRTEDRDVPIVANWIRANTMPASSCSSGTQDVCCSHGRCGLAPADVNRDLSRPTFSSAAN